MKTMIPLKQWLHEQACRNGITPHCLYNRLSRGVVQWPNREHINSRVVLIENRPLDTFPAKPKFRRAKKIAAPPPENCIRLTEWVKSRADKEGLTISAIHTRIWRGKLKIEIVKTGKRFVWVRVSTEDVPHYNPGE